MKSRLGGRAGLASSRARVGLVVAAGMALAAAAGGHEDNHTLPCFPEVPQREKIVKSLEAALDAYRDRDPHRALVWANLAASLLDAEVEADAAERGPHKRWPTSNAPQLFDHLRLYDLLARGSAPEMDTAYEEIMEILEVVERVNASPVKPDRFGSVRLDYDLINHLVTKVGKTRVDYDLITWQIDKIGDRRIDYDLLTRMPHRIGPIEFRYGAINGRIESVAGVRVE